MNAKFTILIFTLIPALLFSCSLNQYNPERSISIRAQFPKKFSKSFSSKLNRPADAVAETYIPPFVDRIKLTVTGDNIDDLIIDKNRNDADFSNDFEFDSEFATNANFNLEAYACNPENLDCCDEGEANCVDNRWILTHSGTISLENLSSSSGNINATIDLETSKTPLDEQEISIGVKNNPSLQYFYNSCIDEEGNIAIIWADDSGTTIGFNYTIIDQHGNRQPDRPLYSTTDTTRILAIGEKCFFKNGIVYVIISTRSISSEEAYINVHKINVNNGYSVEPFIPAISESQSTRSLPFLSMDMASDKLLTAFRYQQVINGYITFNLYSFDGVNATFLDSESKSCLGSFSKDCSSNIYMKIIDENSFLYSFYDTDEKKIWGRICNIVGSKTECDNNLTDLTPQNSIGNINAFSVSQTEDGSLLYAARTLTGIFGGLISTNPLSFSQSIDRFFLSGGLTETQPMLSNYRGANSILVWRDIRKTYPDDTLENFNIYYSLLNIDETSVFGEASRPVSEDEREGNNSTPIVSTNDDGMTLITYIVESTADMEIFYRRYVF